jgi:hypothetical protein
MQKIDKKKKKDTQELTIERKRCAVRDGKEK